MPEESNQGIEAAFSAISRQEVFDREMSMCKRLNQDNGGKCKWGKCEYCGVVPLLYKLYTGKLLEKPEEISAAKEELFGA